MACLVGTATIVAQGADELEVFAGQDKVVRAGSPLDFNDARIIKPEPLNPERTYTFSWDFDSRKDSNLDGVFDNDGDSNERYTSWHFHIVGTYTVTLTVSDWFQVAKDTLEVTVVENIPPVVTAPGTLTTEVLEPLTFEVTAYDEYTQDHLLRWMWGFSDGGTSTDPGPLDHTFSEVGLYNVLVTVYDAEDAMSEAAIYVTVVDTTPPVARAGEDRIVEVGDYVAFDASASSDNYGLKDWFWSFEHNGSEVVLHGERPGYRFEVLGPYTLTLTVLDVEGNEGTDTVEVLVVTEVPNGNGPGGEPDSAPLKEPQGTSPLPVLVPLLFAFIVSIAHSAARRRGG
jgi:PKD repeat protein